MSRQAVVIGEAVEPLQVPLEQALGRFGYTRIRRVTTVAEAVELAAVENVELILLPIDTIADADLLALERHSRQARHMGVIATAPSADPAQMLRAMRAGIQEFLVRPIAATDLAAVVERLHRRTDPTELAGQVFAVFSAKGGVGVTTAAVNLATALASVHGDARVALADLTAPGGDVCLHLNLKPSYSISDLAARIDRLDADMLNSALAPASDGVWVLAAPPDGPHAAEAIDASVTTALIAQFRASFPYTVLDCEHQLTERTLAALDEADRILLLTELKVPALRSTQRTLSVCRRLGYPTDKLCIIVNRFQSSDVVTPSDASRLLNADLFYRLPNDYKSASVASTDGVAIPVRYPQSRLGTAYLQLAQKLTGGTVPDATVSAPGNGTRSPLRRLFSRGRS